MINIQRLEYFLAVAECLNFSKAAERLYVSHQALSKQIRQLEDEIGAKLLERDSAKVVLTEVGKKVVELYAPISRGIQQCEESIRDFVQYKKSAIRIGYFNVLPYRKAVDPVVRYISDSIPNVIVDIMAADIIEAKEALEKDNIDLLIMVVHDWDTLPETKWVPLVTLPQKIVVSEFHPWYTREQISKEDVNGARLLCFENTLGGDKHSFMREVKVKERVYVRNSSTYMGVLAQGTAFGVVSDLYNSYGSAHRLLPLPPEYASEMQLIAAFKPLHPRADVFERLCEIKFPYQSFED